MPTYEYGDTMTVRVLHQSSSAYWSGLKSYNDRDEGYYSPPPGWVILSNSVNVHGVNNGSFSIATMAAGSHFEERHNIANAYDVAINAAANAQDYNAKVNFEHEKNEALDAFDTYSASHNTIRLVTEAHTKGSVVNRIGGGIEVSVDVELMYLCAPGCAGELEQRLVQRIAPRPVIGGVTFQPNSAAVIKNFDPMILGQINGAVSPSWQALRKTPMKGKVIAQ